MYVHVSWRSCSGAAWLPTGGAQISGSIWGGGWVKHWSPWLPAEDWQRVIKMSQTIICVGFTWHHETTSLEYKQRAYLLTSQLLSPPLSVQHIQTSLRYLTAKRSLMYFCPYPGIPHNSLKGIHVVGPATQAMAGPDLCTFHAVAGHGQLFYTLNQSRFSGVGAAVAMVALGTPFSKHQFSIHKI